jgi:hypothetical protein
MGAAGLISLVLSLLQSILAAAKVGGVAPEVIANIEGAVSNLLVGGAAGYYQVVAGAISLQVKRRGYGTEACVGRWFRFVGSDPSTARGPHFVRSPLRSG